jgi:hypothetical protein
MVCTADKELCDCFNTITCCRYFDLLREKLTKFQLKFSFIIFTVVGRVVWFPKHYINESFETFVGAYDAQNTLRILVRGIFESEMSMSKGRTINVYGICCAITVYRNSSCEIIYISCLSRPKTNCGFFSPFLCERIEEILLCFFPKNNVLRRVTHIITINSFKHLGIVVVFWYVYIIRVCASTYKESYDSAEHNYEYLNTRDAIHILLIRISFEI